jgi:2'-deoxynucleoside 5'-phosphate N-hydrolase
MKFYFAGSISGGRQDQSIYAQIIGLLKRHGTVLSEHFGDAALTSAGEAIGDRAIHDRDLAWIREADVIVAEVTTPSLGVGYEIGRALEWGKPMVCLYRPSELRRLSGMIAGAPGVRVIHYTAVAELPAIFDELFSRENSAAL